MKNILFLFTLLLININLIGQDNYGYFIDSLILEKKSSEALILVDSFLEQSDISLPRQITLSTQKIYCQLIIDKENLDLAKKELSIIKEKTLGNEMKLSANHKLRIALSEIMIHRLMRESVKAKAIFKSTFKEIDLTKANPILSLRLYSQFGLQMNTEKKRDSVIIAAEEGAKFLKKIKNSRLKDRMEISINYQKGRAYHFSSELKKARKIFLDVLDKSYSLKDSSKLEILYTYISSGYYRTGEYSQCAHFIKKSYDLKLKKYGPNSNRLLREYQNLGVVYSEQKNFEDANIYYNKGIDLLKRLGGENSSEMGRIIFNLGSVHYNKEEYKEAIKLIEKSLELREANLEPNHADIGLCLQMLGELYLLQEKFDIAKDYFTQALKIRESKVDEKQSDDIKIYSYLSRVNMENENFIESDEYIKNAYEILKYDTQKPYNFENIDNPYMLANPLEMDIRQLRLQYAKSLDPNIYINAKAKLAVADSIVSFMKYRLGDPSSRLSFLTKQQYVIEEILMFHSKYYEQQSNYEPLAEIFRLIEENNNSLMYEKMGSDESNVLMGMPKHIIDRKYELEDSLNYYENRLINTNGDTDAYVLTKVTEYKEAHFKFINHMKQAYPKYFETVYEYPIITLDDYKNVLSDNEISITYHLGTINSLALKVENHKATLYNLGKSKEIKESVKTYLTVLKDRSENNKLTKLSKNLFKKLVEPLAIKNNKNITLICNNFMSLVPFETLLKDDDSYLFESNTISYQYSATTRSHLKKSKSSNKNILAMAPVFEEEHDSQNPVFATLYEADIFRDDLGPLLQSKEELNNIRKNIKGDYYYNEDATERRFKEEAPNAGIIHLATHGFANQNNASKSRLYFHQANDTIEDGMLNAYEIMNLDLKNTNLVTLSACNTGDGSIKSGEGVASLGRAFAYAGCKNQLISLWPANDKSTTQLMSSYYANMKEGQGKSTALKNAKLTYLAEAPEVLKHPYYWAGFVYYGSDSELSTGTGLSNMAILGLCCIGIMFIVYLVRSKMA